MSEQNFEEIFQRIQNLEQQLGALNKSLNQGNHPWGMLNAARVTDFLKPPQNPFANLSDFQLIELYHLAPQIFANTAIKVSLAEASVQQESRGGICLTERESGLLWIVSIDSETYRLFPKDTLVVNTHLINRISTLFIFQGHQGLETKDFRLIKPAKVAQMPNSQQWILEEPGELDFSNTSTISQYQEEIKRLREERQQIQSQLKQFTQNFSDIKQHLADFSAGQVQINRQIQQLWQTVASLSPVPLAKVSSSQPWKNASLKQTLSGHTNLVRCLAVSTWKKQGKKQLIASGGFDHTINLWDAQTGELIQTLIPSSKVVNAIAFSPSEPILVSGGDDNQLQLWITDTFQAINLPGHSNRVLAVTISPDGKTLVSGSRDHTFKIWDLSTLTVRYTLNEDFGTIVALAISPDGKTLVSSHGEFTNGTIRFWNLQTGESNKNYFQHTHLIWSIAISPDSQKVACACRDGIIKIFDLATAELKQNLEAHADNVWSVAISPDGQILASGSSDKTIKLWHLASGELINTLTDHTADVYAVAFNANGRELMSSSRDKTIKIWCF